MNIAFDYTVLGLTNGNSAYTTGLIKGLATVFPDNQYYVFSYLKKREGVRKLLAIYHQ